ncbi:hypothetical protein K3495_g9950 [Podosphaera aphanis]|nr:hypothetical protein K3495_g9950 [Podosphaera aphanis]
MPFDFVAYKAKCDALTTEELQLEWQNYTRQLTSGATMTATSVLFSPLTSGISLIGLGISVPQLHNARKKRKIVGNKMLSQGAEPHTRRRDIAIPAASSVACAALTFGLAPPVAGVIGGEAGAKGVEYIISHATLDALWAVLDETRSACQHKRAQRKLRRRKKQEKEIEISYHYAETTNEKLLDTPPASPFEERKPRSRKIMSRSRKAKKESCRQYLDQEEKKYKNDSLLLPPAYNDRPLRSVSHQRAFDQSSSQVGSNKFALSHRSFSFEGLKPKISRPITPIRELAEKPYLSAMVEEYAVEDDYSSSSDEESDDEDEEIDDEKDPNVVEHILTLEEEVSLLKATILRMEMEKRGLVVEANPDSVLPPPKDLDVKVTNMTLQPSLEKKYVEVGDLKTISSMKNTSAYIIDQSRQNLVFPRPPTPTFSQTQNPYLRQRSSFASRPKKMEEDFSSRSIENQNPHSFDSSSADQTKLNSDDLTSSYRKNLTRPVQKRHDSGYISGYQSSSSVAFTPSGILYDEDGQPIRSSPNKSYHKLNRPRTPKHVRDQRRRSSIATDSLGINPISLEAEKVRYIPNLPNYQPVIPVSSTSLANLTKNMRQERLRMRPTIPKFTPEVTTQVDSDSEDDEGEDEIYYLHAQHRSSRRLSQYAQDPPTSRSWRAPD